MKPHYFIFFSYFIQQFLLKIILYDSHHKHFNKNDHEYSTGFIIHTLWQQDR